MIRKLFVKYYYDFNRNLLNSEVLYGHLVINIRIPRRSCIGNDLRSVFRRRRLNNDNNIAGKHAEKKND